MWIVAGSKVDRKPMELPVHTRCGPAVDTSGRPSSVLAWRTVGLSHLHLLAWHGEA